jgi:ADP-ribose pyrophosphatase YjhB (NUDIX family)
MATTESARQVTRIAAYALCLQDHRILLCRIAPGDWSGVGEWTLPGGGLEFGESPAAGALRELEEETGLQGTIVELLDVLDWSGRWIHPADGVDEAFHGIQIVYRVAVTGRELRVEVSGSTDDARWFSKTETQELPLVELARAGLRLAGWT